MTMLRWPAACASAAVAALALTGLAQAGPTSRAATAAATATATTTQHDPGWALSRLDERWLPVDTLYRMRSSGAGVTAYVIDCAVDTKHPDFGGRASLGANFAGSGGACADELGVEHGTFVAGIIGGRTTGVAKQVRVVSVRTLSGGEGEPPPPTSVQLARVVRAIDWVVAHARRPAVVNMSLNFGARSATLDAAMRRLDAAGILAVVSAGNANGSACAHPPANASTALAVAASTRTDTHWRSSADYGSNYGSCVDIYAPGKDIRSLVPGGVYWYAGKGATSWAAPYVTGAAALYLSAHPQATPAQVRAWILGNSTVGHLRNVPRGTPNRLLYTYGPLG